MIFLFLILVCIAALGLPYLFFRGFGMPRPYAMLATMATLFCVWELATHSSANTITQDKKAPDAYTYYVHNGKQVWVCYTDNHGPSCSSSNGKYGLDFDGIWTRHNNPSEKITRAKLGVQMHTYIIPEHWHKFGAYRDLSDLPDTN